MSLLIRNAGKSPHWVPLPRNRSADIPVRSNIPPTHGPSFAGAGREVRSQGDLTPPLSPGEKAKVKGETGCTYHLSLKLPRSGAGGWRRY